jgi:hypothetical protein
MSSTVCMCSCGGRRARQVSVPAGAAEHCSCAPRLRSDLVQNAEPARDERQERHQRGRRHAQAALAPGVDIENPLLVWRFHAAGDLQLSAAFAPAGGSRAVLPTG